MYFKILCYKDLTKQENITIYRWKRLIEMWKILENVKIVDTPEDIIFVYKTCKNCNILKPSKKFYIGRSICKKCLKIDRMQKKAVKDIIEEFVKEEVGKEEVGKEEVVKERKKRYFLSSNGMLVTREGVFLPIRLPLQQGCYIAVATRLLHCCCDKVVTLLLLFTNRYLNKSLLDFRIQLFRINRLRVFVSHG